MLTKCGTFDYMAPEVLLKKNYNGHIADVWSAGVNLYIMVTGNFPFVFESIPHYI